MPELDPEAAAVNGGVVQRLGDCADCGNDAESPSWHTDEPLWNCCKPPEENGAVMTDPRVDRAFRELLAEGLVERKRRRVTDSYSYFLTPKGRAETPYESTPSPNRRLYPTEGTHDA